MTTYSLTFVIDRHHGTVLTIKLDYDYIPQVGQDWQLQQSKGQLIDVVVMSVKVFPVSDSVLVRGRQVSRFQDRQDTMEMWQYKPDKPDQPTEDPDKKNWSGSLTRHGDLDNDDSESTELWRTGGNDEQD